MLPPGMRRSLCYVRVPAHFLVRVIAGCLALSAGLAALVATPEHAEASEYTFTWAHPRPQGNALGGAAFESNAIGYAVGSRGSVVKTTDGGLSWILVSRFPDDQADLRDVVVLAPGELLAVGAPPGIFHSTDSGASWTAVPNPSTGRLEDIEFVTPGLLSVVGDGGQVLRSTDGGATWSLLASTGGDLAEQLWLDSSNGYVMGMMLVRRTTNGGASWTPVPGIADGDRFNEAFFTDAMHGYILSDFHFWKTTNGGVSWTGDFFTGSIAYCGNTIVLGSQEFLVATNFEGAMIGRTTDGGATWTLALMTGGDGFLDFDRLPDGTLIAVGSEGDIYRSMDNGATWSDRIVGREPYRAHIGALAAGPGGHGAAGTAGTPGEQWYRSDDAGASWSADATGPAIAFTSEIAYWGADHAIAAGDYGKMWRSTDGGVTWMAAALPGAPTNGTAWHVSLPAPGVAFASVTGQTQSMVYRTTDFGASWHLSTTGIPANGSLTGISFVDANVGFVSGYTSGGQQRLFKTTDGGGFWNAVTSTGLPSGFTSDLQFHDALTGLATVGGSGGAGIYCTTNGGVTWTPVSAWAARELSFSNALHGVASAPTFSSSGEVQVTEDGGVSWDPVALPATDSGGAVFALPDGFLVGGRAGVLMKATRVTTSVPLAGADAAARRARMTAAPSIGPNIGIEFQLERQGRAELDVIDVTGRRVATLRSGYFTAGIRVPVVWDGTTSAGTLAAPGVYFVRLLEASGATALRVVLAR